MPNEIPKRTLPRFEQLPLGNNYGILNDIRFCTKFTQKLCGDFHLAIYFRNNYEFKLILRRLDESFWDFNVSIFIEDAFISASNTRFREVFDIQPSSVSHELAIVLKTEKLHLVIDRNYFQNQLIPKTIIQTFRTRYIDTLQHYNAHQTFVELNPEYQIRMFDDRDCRKFIQKYYSRLVVEAYDYLIPPSFNADIFRYA